MARTSFSKLFKCWLHNFGSLVHLFLTENAGGSVICIHRDLLPEEALVTHLITCHGRDHLVNIRTERHSLVIVNVHFEPDLTLGQLRGRLRLIHPHWPAYPNEVGIILDDFNICDTEEGRFNVWNQTFTDGDPGKTAVFHSFFPLVLEVAQSAYRRKDSVRTLSRIDRIFINLPRMISFQSCFAIVLPAPRFPSFRPDTASFRSCLSLPPGFLSTREAGICAGSRACFSLLFLLDFFPLLLIFVRSFRQPSSKLSSSGIEM